MKKREAVVSFFTREQVAQILQVNPMTVYRMIQRGQLKAYKFGTDLRISEKDFNQFLQQSLIRAKGEATNAPRTPKPRKNPKMATQRPEKRHVTHKKPAKRSK